MVAIVSKTSSSGVGYLRPFDIRRDLNPVADLVELCFADTLDADGKRYLRQMRDAARSAGFLHWASSMAENAGLSLTGYVWIEAGQLVGNLSLIPYTVKDRRRYLIANVAVHPAYRRRGIARRLTEEAQQFARRKNTPPTWLHVREDNEPAKNLYVSLGFEERTRRTTWHSVPAYSLRVDAPPGVVITSRKPQHWEIQYAWLQRAYPSEFSWHLPLKINSLRPGFLEAFSSLFSRSVKRHWAALQGEKLLAVLTWQSSSGFNDFFWLAAPPQVNGQVIGALLRYARLQLSANRTIALDYPAHIAEDDIRSAGFEEHQTLIWMEDASR